MKPYADVWEEVDKDEAAGAEDAGTTEATAKKRTYNHYPPEVVEFYFDFEKQMGGPRTSIVNFVKDNYPSLFPKSFCESRVRAWEKGIKEPKEEKPGRGLGWR